MSKNKVRLQRNSRAWSPEQMEAYGHKNVILNVFQLHLKIKNLKKKCLSAGLPRVGMNHAREL